MLKRTMNKLNDTKEREPIINKDNNNEENSASASGSGSDNEKQNEIENINNNVTLNDDALIDLEILKKEFSEFKISSLDSIKCLKHEVKRIINNSCSNERKKKNEKSSKRTNHQDDIFGEITNHQMLTKVQKEIRCIKYELKKLILNNNKLISNRNVKFNQKEEETNSGSDFEEDENDSKNNNKQEKAKINSDFSDDLLETLRRVLKWEFVDVLPEIYIDKETKNHIVPSPVLPIISTLIEEDFFKSSSVDLSTFNSAMKIIKDEFPQIKMNSQDSRFICTYLVMIVINSNSSKFNFEKERV